ncbi:MAG: alanine--tRNA ligase-related protein [Candidatus Liptonbacteria bacterium]|nr:alanine--tRNA ligase-related protein [Candidatus Liptonbacteria bacterium]
MTSAEIRQKFLDYMKGEGHAIVASSSLVPDDPSVLLTTAGMQQFKKYYTGEADAMKDFGAKSTASAQKSFRTSDIESVGDESHLTFFEMLGNFSFGGYFKKEAIAYGHEFITKVMGLEISYVSIFEGKDDIGVPKDTESREIWKSLGVPENKIVEQGMSEVFWGPTGSAGPCGPTTEIYCKNAQGQEIEVWNIVFNQFFYPGSRDELMSGEKDKKLEPLKTPGVDTGMGLERLVMIAQGVPTIFDTDLFQKPLGEILKPLGGDVRPGRIIADHLRATAFLLADGVRPANKERGYILRRLIRRLLVHSRRMNISVEDLAGKYIPAIVKEYGNSYLELQVTGGTIADEFRAEAKKFGSTLDKGLREFDRRYPAAKGSEIEGKKIGADAFGLYQSYGFPLEVIGELLAERSYKFDEAEFRAKLDEEIKKHQEISRAGTEKKFGGHGLILDTGELKASNEEELKKVTRLHTATHMLQKALREVLGEEVSQAGSDITVERTRFDFTYPRKLTPEEIKKVEDLVNKKVGEDLPMQKVLLPLGEAMKTGALHFFSAKGGSASGGKDKYPDIVNVYFIGKDIDSAWSKEFCGGPHVTHSGEVGNFKIKKEEAVASGVRRIRAIVE